MGQVVMRAGTEEFKGRWWALGLGLMGIIGTGGGLGCLGQVSDPVPEWPLDEALVVPETVEATFEGDEIPEDEGELMLGEGALTLGQALVGEEARLRPPLRDGLILSNQMIRPGILILNSIARNNPPKEVSGDRAVWEVQHAQAIHTLVIERDALVEGQFNYSLKVRPALMADTRARELLSGFFRPGPRLPDGRQTGAGLLRYEYDTFRALPGYGVNARGVGAVGFKTTAEGREFNIVLERFQARPDATPLSARYHYKLGGDRSGEFCFQLKTDIIPQVEGRETLTEVAVWNSSRAGKAKAHLSALGTQGLLVDECWDPAGKQVWIQWDPDINGEESDGNENACEGALVDLDLKLCDLDVVPGEDPAIPR